MPAVSEVGVKRLGPEIEYWVESWGWEQSPAVWEFHSIHQTKAEARECMAQQYELHGGRWRIVEVARWPVEVLA